MIIEASAPTRVDLAGGTIDIPPLLFVSRRRIHSQFCRDFNGTLPIGNAERRQDFYRIN